jgi:hypothetical protein
MCKLPLRLEVWGYTNEVRLPFGNGFAERGLIFIACGGRLCLCSRDFNRSVFLLSLGCSPDQQAYLRPHHTR